jgi:hypothetical protein
MKKVVALTLRSAGASLKVGATPVCHYMLETKGGYRYLAKTL